MTRAAAPMRMLIMSSSLELDAYADDRYQPEPDHTVCMKSGTPIAIGIEREFVQTLTPVPAAESVPY